MAKKREREKKVLVWPNQWSQIKVNGWHQHKRGKPQIWDLESIETGLEDLDWKIRIPKQVLGHMTNPRNLFIYQPLARLWKDYGNQSQYFLKFLLAHCWWKDVLCCHQLILLNAILSWRDLRKRNISFPIRSQRQ